MKTIIYVYLALLFCDAQAAGAPQSLRDKAICGHFLQSVRMATLTADPKPYREFKAAFPGSRPEMVALERDLFKLLEMAPDFRDSTELERKWSLSHEQVADLVLFTIANLEFVHPAVTGTEVRNRFRYLSRYYYVLGSNEPAARHFGFYILSLTNLGVPQMASLLNKSEGQVLQEITRLDLSIAEAYLRKPTRLDMRFYKRQLSMIRPDLIGSLKSDLSLVAQARLLRRRGLTSKQVSEIMGIPLPALNYFFRVVGATLEDLRWDRIVEFEGRKRLEPELLAIFHDRLLSPVEIAEILNILFRTPEGHPERRTGQTIAIQLNQLRFSDPEPLIKDSIYDPHYGYLKYKGRLVPSAFVFFLLDNAMAPDSWFCRRLQISVKELEDFHMNWAARTSTDAFDEMLGRYADQEVAVSRTLDWIFEKSSIPQRSRSFGPLLLGSFPSVEQAWRAVRKAMLADPRFHQHPDSERLLTQLNRRINRLITGRNI